MLHRLVSLTDWTVCRSRVVSWRLWGARPPRVCPDTPGNRPRSPADNGKAMATASTHHTVAALRSTPDRLNLPDQPLARINAGLRDVRVPRQLRDHLDRRPIDQRPPHKRVAHPMRARLPKVLCIQPGRRRRLAARTMNRLITA